MHEHTTGHEGESHKAWVITSKGVAAGGVHYKEGVADHPMVQIHVPMGCAWDSDTEPVGHKPTGVRGWGQREKQAWGAVMECVSDAALNTAQWVAMYREVLAAVEAHCTASAPAHSMGSTMPGDRWGGSARSGCAGANNAKQ